MSKFTPRFTDRDYNSDHGMMTFVWGPALWHVLHTISFNYPVRPTPEQMKQYKLFLISLGYVLPCCYCRNNYRKNLVSAGFNDGVLRTRSSFSRFIFRLHNTVNGMLNKDVDLTYEQVRDMYEHFRARCDSNTDAKELGCTNPVAGVKTKCVLKIVPKDMNVKTFSVDGNCFRPLGSTRQLLSQIQQSAHQ